MFTITHSRLNGFDVIVLSEQLTGTKAVIAPAAGAMLYAFEIQHSGKPLNVIDQYKDHNEYTCHQAEKGFKGAKLSPFACRLKNGRYSFSDQDHKIKKFYLGNHAMHGLLYDANFMPVKEQAAEKSALVKMEYSYRGEDEGYPFCYDCVVSYELGFDNFLTIITTIINKDQGEIPVSDGWHPYFTFNRPIDELQLEFQSKEQLLFDEEMLPDGRRIRYENFGSLEKIGNKHFDDCYTVNFAECQPMAVLRDPVMRAQVEIYPTHAYPYLQLYTPENRLSIAIENLSAAPDAFNNGEGLIILPPGQEKDFKTSYKVTSLV